MKTLFRICIIILGLNILFSTVAVTPVYGRRGGDSGGTYGDGSDNSSDWHDGRFRKAEREARMNGSDPNWNSTNYVADLYMRGQLADPSSAQNAAGVALAKAQIGAMVQASFDANNGNLPGGSTVALYTAELIYRMQHGFLLMNDLAIIHGNCNSGGLGCSLPGGGMRGYYTSIPAGCNVAACVRYYAVGTGPNPTAGEGKTVNAQGTPIPTQTPTPTPTPIPVGTIRARAVTMTTIPETCQEIKAETTYRSGQSFAVYKGTASQGTRTQSGSSYVSWSLYTNTYRLVPLSPGVWSIRVCETDSTGSHFGQYSANLPAPGTVTFDVAFAPPPGWYQVQGGDVYAGLSLTSLTNANVSPRSFILDGTGGDPGIAQYGGGPTDYDFASDENTKGETYVSSTDWLVNGGNANRDFYNYFYSRLGSPSDVTPDLPSPLTKPTYDATKSPVYYIQGDVTTSGNWVVGAGEKYIFLIDGNLDINGKINITGNGFIAFIVKGNITMDSSVGVTFASVTPVVEGVYVTSGTIHTGDSSVAGKERFVGKGMFVGNDIQLERDLSSVNQNVTASELFIYNPGLLISMPDQLKSVPLSWQEVAP